MVFDGLGFGRSLGLGLSPGLGLGLGLHLLASGCAHRPAVENERAKEAASCAPEVVKKRAALVAAGSAVVSQAVVDLFDRLPAADLSAAQRSAAGDSDGPRVALGDQALFGDLLEVLPPKGDAVKAACGFVEVRTDSGYPGYVSVSGLLPWASRGTPYRSGGRLRVVSRFANVFAQPDVTKENPLLRLPLGVELRFVRRLTLPGEPDRWREIELPSGAHAYVHQGDVVEVGTAGSSGLAATAAAGAAGSSGGAAPAPLPACVIAQGLAHEGTPYLWGGRSTYGIDCSGLVANAFRACGIVSPRDAGPQADWSAVQALPLAVETLAPGDLVFFGKRPPTGAGQTPAKPKISHVGIYVGEGRFVHATTTEHPTVHVSDLREPHWSAIWVAARRYAGTAPK